MTPLPLTVIGGYLGAGKTTLINRLLAEPHGLRITVLVNDFGAVNIDASLIASQTDDVIALTNGCVCCTMGADLFMAVGDALDRRPRADHLIVEASGIADPRSIADVGRAEPDLRYAGIVTLVDAQNIVALLDDPLVAPQVHRQIAVADLTLLTKASALAPALTAYFRKNGLQPPQIMCESTLAILALDAQPTTPDGSTAVHPTYVTWHTKEHRPRKHDAVLRALEERPPGLFRLKGHVMTERGRFLVQVVGSDATLTLSDRTGGTEIVALGPAATLSRDAVAAWWNAVPAARRSSPTGA